MVRGSARSILQIRALKRASGILVEAGDEAMRPRPISDLHDWADSFFNPAVDGFDTNFSPLASDNVAHLSADAALDLPPSSVSDQDVVSTSGQHGPDDDAAAPPQEGTFTYEVSS